MTPLAICGYGTVCADTAADPGQPAGDLDAMYCEPLPVSRAHALVDFDVKAELGRKGTGFFDRRTALSVVACGRALAHAGLEVDDGERDRIGVVIGTTAGSVRSAVDYAVETFVQDPPYLVNPGLFPNTVMNGATGQSAIWYGLRGVNATIAGGQVAFLSVLRYCGNVFRGGHADVMLAGAVEEFTPHAAWLSWRGRNGGTVLPGEAAAMFVVRDADAVASAYAEVASVALGFCPDPGERPGRLASTVGRALAEACADPASVTTVATGGRADEHTDRLYWHAIQDVLGQAARPAARLNIEDRTGDCQAATPALELADMLAARHRGTGGTDGVSVLTAWTSEGALGAAVIKGWRRDRDRR